MAGCRATNPAVTDSTESLPESTPTVTESAESDQVFTPIRDCRAVKECEEITTNRRLDPLTGLTWKCFGLPEGARCAALIDLTKQIGGFPADLNHAEIISRLK